MIGKYHLVRLDLKLIGLDPHCFVVYACIYPLLLQYCIVSTLSRSLVVTTVTVSRLTCICYNCIVRYSLCILSLL